MKKRFISSFVEAKFLIARCLTLLILALLSTNLAWGETGTIKIIRSSFPSGALSYNVTDNWSVTASTGETISGEGDLYSTKDQTTMQSKNSGVSTMYHNTVATPGPITKITLKCASGTTRTYTAYMNKTTAITSTSDGTSKGTIAPTAGNTASLSLDADDGWHYFWLNLAGGASYLDYIEIEYMVEDGKTLTSIAVNSAPSKTEYFVGDYFNPAGLEITATYDTGSPEEIAYAGNESKFTFNPTLTTALQISNTSVEIAYGGKTCTQDITVTARPAFTVTLGDNSETLTEETAGAGVTLPEREPANKDYTFAGWSTTNVTEETETAPTTILVGTYYPSANITLYPIFTRTETSSGFSNYEKVTSTPADWSGQYLLSTGTYTATGTISSSHLTRDNYTNFALEAKSREFTLAKVGDVGYSIKFGDNYLGWSSGTNFDITTDTPTETSTGYLWTLSTDKICNVKDANRTIGDGGSDFRPYSQTPTNGFVYLYKRIEGGSKTFYISNPPTLTVKAPIFTPADGTKFASALDVTIACATEDATIKFSTDNGDTWNNYSAPINITETTTIQAKAIKETIESEVVSATYTQLAGLLSMKENGSGTYKLTNVVVTYVNGTNAMIQDATAGAYLYGCATGLAVGDVFNGDVTVTTNEHKGLFEVTAFDVTNAIKTTDLTKVASTVVTAAELMNTENYDKYESMLVTIEDATVASAFSSNKATIEQNGTSVTLYDQFNQGLEAEVTALVDVTGYLSKYNSVQFWVKSQDDIVVKSAGKKTSTIKFTKANGSYCVDDVEEFAATAYDEEGVARTDAYTITYTSSNSEIAEVVDGYILAYAEGKVTITASTPATDDFAAAEATFDITILPKGTIWFEDFTGMEETKDVTGKYTTTGTVTLYNQTIAGGTAPEILLNGTFKVDLSSKNVDAGIYTLTFKSNNGAEISVNGGVVIPAVKDSENDHLWSTQIYVTDPSVFDITFSRKSNSRLDNFMLAFDHAANTSDVTIASSGYSSFSSTYAVTIPEGVTAYYATGVEGNKVSMIEVEGGVIPANEGVIIKGVASQEYTFIETVSDKTFNDNKLVAVSEKIESLNPIVNIGGVDFKNYVFTGGQFHPFTSGATVSVGAGKAYLQVEKPSDPNAKLEMSFGDVTGIESLIPTLSKGKGVYNLQGVRVSENYKGIIIVNGKKYMNK